MRIFLVLLVACGGETPDDGTIAVPGDPTRFDPVSAIPAIADYAGSGSQLVSFQMAGVRADGTVDATLEHARAHGTYEFVRDVPAPADAPPVGAGGSLDGLYHETVRVDVGPPDVYTVRSGESVHMYQFRGMERHVSQGTGAALTNTAPVTCSLPELWKGLDAPAGAEASVRYDAGGWELTVSGTPLRAEFGPDCQPGGGVPAAPVPVPAVDPAVEPAPP